MLGKILRIDVDQTDSGKNYAVPGDNPYVSDSSFIPEIWAYGLRNPWKISFDRENGDLFIADVGQNLWEEVNHQPSSSTGGENYGWRLMEGKERKTHLRTIYQKSSTNTIVTGTHCFDPEDCTIDPSLTMPILEYEHVNGACSVTGGYIYRGSKQTNSNLQGVYIYGDFCSGDFWGAEQDEDGNWTNTLVKQASGLLISSFGEKKSTGQIFVADYATGSIYVIDQCRDKKNYYFKFPKRTCKFISRRQNRIQKYCKRQQVFRKCKNTCSNPTC